MDKLKDKKGKKMEHLNIQIEWNTFSTTSETDRVWYIHKHVPEMTDKCMYTLACACLYSSVPIKLCLIWKLAHSFGATNVLQPASQSHYTPIWHCTVNYIIIVGTMTTAANCDLYTITTTQLSLDGWIHTWSHSMYKCTSVQATKEASKVWRVTATTTSMKKQAKDRKIRIIYFNWRLSLLINIVV